MPDLYQGGEIWDFSLVDPDNRRPVDYGQRAAMLKKLGSMDAEKVMAGMDEGLPKLWVIHQALKLRAECPEWFGAEAAYIPLSAEGPQTERVIACRRGEHVIAVAPRWSHRAPAWDGTTLPVPAGSWRDRLTGSVVNGGNVALEDLLGKFPVALLVRDAG